MAGIPAAASLLLRRAVVKQVQFEGDVREFVSGGEGGTPRSDEVRTMEHPRCRKLRRSRAYLLRFG